MDYGQTLHTVETYRCPNCQHTTTGVTPIAAGFTKTSGGGIVCPSCNSPLNRP